MKHLANALTLSRFALAGFFMYFLSCAGATAKAAALIFFLLAALTDLLDGWVARSAGAVSSFGRLMDPLADKFLTISALVMFVQMGILYAWMVALVIVRDVGVTAVRLAMPAGQVQGSRRSGKHKTAAQFIYILSVLGLLAAQESRIWRAEWVRYSAPAVEIGMLLVVVLTLWSGFSYLAAHRRALEG